MAAPNFLFRFNSSFLDLLFHHSRKLWKNNSVLTGTVTKEGNLSAVLKDDYQSTSLVNVKREEMRPNLCSKV